jgi:hypothetical protein
VGVAGLVGDGVAVELVDGDPVLVLPGGSVVLGVGVPTGLVLDELLAVGVGQVGAFEGGVAVLDVLVEGPRLAGCALGSGTADVVPDAGRGGLSVASGGPGLAGGTVER